MCVSMSRHFSTIAYVVMTASVVALQPSSVEGSEKGDGISPAWNRHNPAALRFFPESEGAAGQVSFASIGGVAARLSTSGVFLGASDGSSEAVRVQIPGADFSRLEALQPLPGQVNVYRGQDPSAWTRKTSSYRALAYRQLFPASDLTFSSSGSGLQVALRLGPGRQTSSFRLAFENAGVSFEDSRLVVASGADRWILGGLEAYQIQDGRRQSLAAAYAISEGGIGFDIGSSHDSLPLYLTFRIGPDTPRLPEGNGSGELWQTTVGGSGGDSSSGIDYTPDGDVVVTGSTSSPNLPVSEGASQPGFNGGFGDGYLVRLDGSTGEIQWLTYFGGSGFDESSGLVAAPDGKICIVGSTTSNDLPLMAAIDTRGGDSDAMVACFDQTGGLLFSSFLSGTQYDVGTAIASDAAGDLYLTGFTESSNLLSDPTLFEYDDESDGWVLKISADGIGGSGGQGVQAAPVISWGTYIGGSSIDESVGIAVDTQGATYLVGQTYQDNGSFDFPIQNAFQTQASGPIEVFVASIDATGETLLYSSFLGGGSADIARAISVPEPGQAYVSGYTQSSNFPTVNPLQGTLTQDQAGFFALVVSGAGPAGGPGSTLAFSTYQGAGDASEVQDIEAISQGSRTFVATAQGNSYFGETTFEAETVLRFFEVIGDGAPSLILRDQHLLSDLQIAQVALNPTLQRMAGAASTLFDPEDSSQPDVKVQVFDIGPITGGGSPPLWVFGAGSPCGVCPEEEAQFDGLAMTNFGDTDAVINLELFEPQGEGGSPSTAVVQGGNLAQIVLPPGQQIARLRSDLFGGDASSPAWIELTGDTQSLGTFFQFGTGFLSQLDGGVAITETSTSFAFTRVFDGEGAFRGQDAGTGLAIFNPNNDPVTLELTYGIGLPAGAGPIQAVVEIPARSMVASQPSELFGFPVNQGIITGEVTQGGGVVAFELIQLANQATVLGLNAATGNPGTVAYSAQLASQPGLFTNVNVVNRGNGPRNVTLRAIGEDGSALVDPFQQLLQPGQAFFADAKDLFGLAGSSPSGEVNLVGSLVVEADGDGIEGDVIFGDSENFRYAASLPLQTRTFTEALFNQVANISGFFTGLAFFYPGDSQQGGQGEVPDAEITIQVFLPDGTLVGETVETLALGERFARLVSQLIEEAVNLGGGYVHIVSTQPVVGQMLFGVVGPQGIQLLSAVPPTVIQ